MRSTASAPAQSEAAQAPGIGTGRSIAVVGMDHYHLRQAPARGIASTFLSAGRHRLSNSDTIGSQQGPPCQNAITG